MHIVDTPFNIQYTIEERTLSPPQFIRIPIFIGAVMEAYSICTRGTLLISVRTTTTRANKPKLIRAQIIIDLVTKPLK